MPFVITAGFYFPRAEKKDKEEYGDFGGILKKH